MYMIIKGQGHYLTLPQSHLHMKIKTLLSQKPQGHLKPISYVSFEVQEMKTYEHGDGHMTKMASMALYGINPSKSFLPEPVSQLS